LLHKDHYEKFITIYYHGFNHGAKEDSIAWLERKEKI